MTRISHQNLGRTRPVPHWASGRFAELAAGEALLRVDRVGLTADNVRPAPSRSGRRTDVPIRELA
jgi:hypothetical protein